MADRFYKDIEVPDLQGSSALPAPDAGFIQVFGRKGKLAYQASTGSEVVLEPSVQTVLKIDGGSAATTFPQYLLRLDFGQNGSSINPTGTP
jgi:hypothetical protein